MQFLKALLLLLMPLALQAQVNTNYFKELQQWHTEREQALAAENGWINLAGRYILKPGANTFGSAKDNAVKFPKGKCAARMGTLLVGPDSVWVLPARKADIRLQGNKIRQKMLLYPGPEGLTLHSGSLRYFIIRRGTQFILRLRDLEHPALKTFHGIPVFPADTSWRVRAKLERRPGKTIPITNVLGQTTQMDCPGTLHFTLQGRPCRLDPVYDDGQLFLIFADPTNGTDTYGSGRFLYADQPDAEGYTILDFNRAINPPCAFTPFATCPLPPAQNRLTIEVSVGEKAVEH